MHVGSLPRPSTCGRPQRRRRSPARAGLALPAAVGARWRSPTRRLPRDSSGLPSWRRMGRARSVDVDAVDRQRRGGASACDEPGAKAEEGGSRADAEQRCNDSAEDSAEDSDQQSARLRRLAVGRDRTRDPARYNSQDHPSGETHCAALSITLVTRLPCTARIRSHPMIDGAGTSAHTA